MLTVDNGITTNASKSSTANAYHGAAEQVKLAYMAVRTKIMAETVKDGTYSAIEHTSDLAQIVSNDLSDTNKWNVDGSTEGKIKITYTDSKIDKDAISEGIPSEEGKVEFVIKLEKQNATLQSDGEISVGEGSGTGSGGETETPLGPNNKPLVNQTTIAQLTEEKIVGEDKYGNQVVIPEGFKLAQGANGSGDCVKDGIVIDDGVGNQYVWIPVSNINHDGSNKIMVNSAEEEGIEITLGRYTFDTSSPWNPTLAESSYQYANSFSTPVTIGGNKQELTTYRQSNGLEDTTGTNTTARGVYKNSAYNGIQGFIESVRDNKGYYVARYEASYRTNGKAGSIPSTSIEETLALTSVPSTRLAGDLWKFITQGDAAEACYDLYTTVNSDLMNSYAWDTAIVYIQAMGNTNYVNANRGSNTTLLNTGSTGDEKCKIFDMAGNEVEWTTEYSTFMYSSYAYPCVYRGGCSDSSGIYTRYRGNHLASRAYNAVSFRSVLYL